MDGFTIFWALWLLTGVVAYAGTLAYFQTEFPMFRDVGDFLLAVMTGVMGPWGIVITFCFGGGFKHGLQFIPKRAMSWDEYYSQRRGDPWS